ncbi:MAG: UvrD-helicase domain-containing protein [Oscillospiraceae bacterium]|nr:UvrD-helicase domain-containing protein [Oscillospiraceae bacterium]
MFIADFHIHSKYSRATSKDCVPEILDLWARRKGLNLIGTGDFTHAAWREELKEKLSLSEEGLYILKESFHQKDHLDSKDFQPRFIVSGEISSIYKKNGKVRKVHNLILLPSLETAEALARKLESIGNLHSDGRPILGLDSRDLLEITLNICPDAVFIPAHIWTPHFSLFGAYSGFDDINECFEDLTKHICALETGLSSDPPMNWRLSALDRFTLVSNSDAHSPGNLAREANLFDVPLSYPNIVRALENPGTGAFQGTIEFFPEEGKYHYDGHRNCNVCQKPADTIAAGGICPVCGGRIIVGVLHRVEALADRAEGAVAPAAKKFESLVPLAEVIASASGFSPASKNGREAYASLLRHVGTELFILRQASLADIECYAGVLVAEGIRRLRAGQVNIRPGYDGEYGKIKLFDENERAFFSGQLCLFEAKQDAQPLSQNTAIQDGLSAEPAADIPGKVNSEKESLCLPDSLNSEQREAVFSAAPAIAVVAGPGTGKTRTLVSRIVHLVREEGVRPSEITAVTFTNKAAGEMRTRLEKELGSKRTVNAMSIGTFHSICLNILSGWNKDSSVTVIDDLCALSVVQDILKILGLKQSARNVLHGISLIKNNARLPEDTDVPSVVYERYGVQLEQYGVLDYDDILLKALERMEKGETDKRLQGSFSYLFVDEFQDINPIQYRLIRAWSKNSKGLFVIGDPDQSIYGFRGSVPHCFEWVGRDYPSVQSIRLVQNYRSTPEILCCATSLIDRKSGDVHTRLLEANKKSGAKVRLLEADSAFSEAVFAAKEIGRMVGGIDMLHSGKRRAAEALFGFSDIAVLYRTNRQARVLEECLSKEGIPYVVAGRDEFMSEPPVRSTIAFFRFLLNPRDLISLRVCLSEYSGYPADLIQAVLEKYTGAEKSVSSLSVILKQLGGDSAKSEKFMTLLNTYLPLVKKEKPETLIKLWMDEHFPSELSCMQMLLHTSVLYPDMQDFLQTLILGQESDIRRAGGKAYSRDAVSLMTLHGAKGLEFPVVFLCGVTQGLIPFTNRDGEDHLDEERRLFYVGMTRAQDELILLTSPERSPFLASLPKELLFSGGVFARKPAPEGIQLSLFK